MLDSDPNLNISLQSLPKGTKEEERKKCEVQGDGFLVAGALGIFLQAHYHLYIFTFLFNFLNRRKLCFIRLCE